MRREGFRLVLARAADGRAVGFGYGYTGQPGQWWCDRMRDRLPTEIADTWLGGHFADRALLTTWRDNRPARRLYLRKGWQPLADIVEDDASLQGVRLPTHPR